ncbi:MaoC family dehydratase [Nakamurella sp. PAMC28650]|uniref:MaoC family dehydratase n=1 Tax=Nakamurella sp. PAMC28650 TaxID=2762325 RepID=UPI00164D9CFB|nr:MaoC family dehydratase [Nakamurella sp. PAMC28650]QNK79281.1 MaoC family dehydratase [Nakamurella sp. PAMC28650]
MRTFSSADELLAAVGDTLGPGEPFLIEQSRIQAFADATDDHQWIHLDEERAAAGPFGTRIAHGFLTLSLLPVLMGGLYRLTGVTMAVNYGLNKVRFPSPLPTGSSVIASAVITEVTPVSEGILQVVMTVSITAQGANKPCCVAESVGRFSFAG